MARYPAAVWRPVARYQPGGSSCVVSRGQRRVILHTAVGGASLYEWFKIPGRATSHFHVNAAGGVEQYIDTAYRSTANLEGNPDCITVESQDMNGPFPAWSGSNVPAWTELQVQELARLCAWANAEHGVPLVLLPSSKPGTTGVGWHRQGISPWRVAGGESWSNSAGKVCPGNLRVAQIPRIVDLARGGPNLGGFLMALSDGEQRQMLDWLRNVHARVMGGIPPGAARPGYRLLDTGDGGYLLERIGEGVTVAQVADAITAALAAAGLSVDEKAIADAVAARLAQAVRVAGQVTVDPADLAGGAAVEEEPK